MSSQAAPPLPNIDPTGTGSHASAVLTAIPLPLARRHSSTTCQPRRASPAERAVETSEAVVDGPLHRERAGRQCDRLAAFADRQPAEVERVTKGAARRGETHARPAAEAERQHGRADNCRFPSSFPSSRLHQPLGDRRQPSRWHLLEDRPLDEDEGVTAGRLRTLGPVKGGDDLPRLADRLCQTCERRERRLPGDDERHGGRPPGRPRVADGRLPAGARLDGIPIADHPSLIEEVLAGRRPLEVHG